MEALSEQQRQQVIAQLLAARRSRAASSGPPALRVDDAERSRRVQALIQERAAARQAQQQLLGPLPDPPAPDELLSPSSTCSQQSRRGQQPQQLMHHHHQQQQPCQQLLLSGPVDVSSLWARSLSEQPSTDTLASDEGDYSERASSSSSSSHQRLPGRGGARQHHLRQGGAVATGQDHQQQQQQQVRQPQRPLSTGRQRPQMHRQQQQHPAPQQPRCVSAGRQRAATPSSYPACGGQRLQQLAQPKVANRDKYEQMRLAAEQELLQQCSFAPRTGRGPCRQLGEPGRPACERLFAAAAQRQAALAAKAREATDGATAGCTFAPATNAAANARHLGRYEYIPLQQRTAEVLRSKREKLAALQQQLEGQAADEARFAPRINPRSAQLAARRRSGSRSASRERAPRPASPAGGGGGGSAAAVGGSPGLATPLDCSSCGRDSSAGRAGLRRSRSEPELDSCSFSPAINPSSSALLAAAGIPSGFLQRQAHFEARASEKRQLLALALAEQHQCSFSPAAGGGRGTPESDRRSSGGFLGRIEQLACEEPRQREAARAARADALHSSQCTFSPAINPRSRRIAQATPLEELYADTRGKVARGAAALAAEAAHQRACTFAPSLAKPGQAAAQAPAGAKLSLSTSGLDDVVRRLHGDGRPGGRGDQALAAASLREYQEAHECTFTPAIKRAVPKQQGPVLVRGLGRFLELKALAARQAADAAAVRARVFLERPGPPRAAATVPVPFKLGRGGAGGAGGAGGGGDGGDDVRQRPAAAGDVECTFRPAISSRHVSRQQRVRQLLDAPLQ